MKSITYILLIGATLIYSPLYADFSPQHDKVYLDEDDINFRSNTFYVHIGGNEWIETNTVHRDNSGLFTYECSIQRSMKGPQAAYEKKWKCPYCYQYWPIGKKCQNEYCPSKYKDWNG